MDEGTELFAKGCLGTCWYGKYHYLEPWVGCEHNCHYCYARCRDSVRSNLQRLGTTFERPATFFKERELLERIKHGANSGDVSIVKLSRFTDILSPSFVRDGLTFKILQALCDSKVKRVIITTKGSPDERTVELIKGHPDKFSYNVVAKPAAPIVFEPSITDLEKRLTAASEIKKAGVLTTVHMDPLVAGIEDDENSLRALFEMLRSLGLNRVMFSFLLLSTDIVSHMAEMIGNKAMQKVMGLFEQSSSVQHLPNQPDTIYMSMKKEIREEAVRKISSLLKEYGFEFVLCSLKSTRDRIKVDKSECPLCNGTFYA